MNPYLPKPTTLTFPLNYSNTVMNCKQEIKAFQDWIHRCISSGCGIIIQAELSQWYERVTYGQAGIWLTLWDEYCQLKDLTDWGQVMHICINKLSIIGSDDW